MMRDDGDQERRTQKDVEGLLLEIAHCPVVRRCLEQPELVHPCAQIVRSQGAATVADFQVPEPWTGQIATAPILFLSSNPSSSRSDPPSDLDEEFPTGSKDAWPDARVVDFFDKRFGDGREAWTRNGLYVLRRDGSFSQHWVRFWASAKARATEALGREAVPGRDFAMTEVVRCKSTGEGGVASAAGHCPDR